MKCCRPSASRVLPRVCAVGTALLATGLSLLGAYAVRARADQPALLRIALTGRILQEVPEAKAKEATQSMQTLVETQTGHPNRLVVEQDVLKMADQLARNDLDFGIFLGFEFAWARQKDPKLVPLVVALIGDD